MKAPSTVVAWLALVALAVACGRQPASSPPAAGGHKNLLRWATAEEKETVGFDVYRAERKDGPYQRITAQPVPGAGATREPRTYAYEDATIDPSKEYFYYVEVVKTNGDRLRVTGAIRAKAKVAPAAAS